LKAIVSTKMLQSRKHERKADLEGIRVTRIFQEYTKGNCIWKAIEASKYGDAPSGKIMSEMSNPVKQTL